MSPQISYVEALAPSVVDLRREASGRESELDGVVRLGAHDSISALTRLTPDSKHTHRGHVNTQQNGGHLQPKEETSESNPPCWHLHCGLPSLRTEKINVAITKIHVVMAAVANIQIALWFR